MQIGSFNYASDHLHFVIHAKLPDEAKAFYLPALRDIKAAGLPVIATTFPDFCWQLAEGTNRDNVDQTPTTIPAMVAFDHQHSSELRKVVLGDLTWALPSKFADDLIEVMHALNMTLLEGFLENSVIYGPF